MPTIEPKAAKAEPNRVHGAAQFVAVVSGMLFTGATHAIQVCEPRYNVTGAAETFTVPAAVTTISIEARGADGGSRSPTNNNPGSGSGALISADAPVTPGDSITIIVGEAGEDGVGNEAGGGGGTGVFINNSLYILAGAGGGGDNTGQGRGALLGNNGSPGTGNAGGAAGTGGNGGGFGVDNGAGGGNGPGGGGGLNGAGGTNPLPQSGGGGGACVVGGNPVGGAGGSGNEGAAPAGGFGCGAGGAATLRESGGGGGFSGGGGGGASGRPGSGGSFFSTSYPNLSTTAGVTGGGNRQDGYVEICYEQLRSDLSITKSDFATTYTPGTSSTYQIIVSNSGPDDVAAAVISDALPDGVTLSASWTCSASAGSSCSANSGGTAGDSAINLTADIQNGGTISISVPVIFSANMGDY